VEALRGLADVFGLVLVTVGTGKFSTNVAVPHVPLGFIQNRRVLSLVYSAADVVVVPSEADNFPNVALEAQACGTPVVGFRVGGLAEVVADGSTGLLVPPRDVEALRAAIRHVLGDDGARAQMAQAARRRAVEEFSLELHARRFVELYETILSRGASAAASVAVAR
jgi:glycosyltransferase involved in cell wall biosynthesis